MATKKCVNCGKTFETKGAGKYCLACRTKGYRTYTHGGENARAKMALDNLELMEAEAPEIPKKNEALDAKLADLHAQGLTYADAQKAETLKMIGKVNVEVEPIQHTYYEELKPITDKDLEQAAETAWAFAKAIKENLIEEEVNNLFEYSYEDALAAFMAKKASFDKIAEVL